MLTWVGLVVVAVLPKFGPPALLVDIETGPSRQVHPQLIEANDDGVLYTQLEREGGTALWWSRWDGVPERVRSLADAGVRARAFKDGFILFASSGEPVAVERLDLSSAPALEPLITVTDVDSFPLTDSTTSVWWGGSAGTFVTDGTSGGTRLVTPLAGAIAALGDRLFYMDSRSLQRWENGQLFDTGVPAGRPFRAGGHLVINGVVPRNETGVALTSALGCSASGGGDFAWLACDFLLVVDAGHILSTDGTPEGTTTRLTFRGTDRLATLDVASSDYVLFSGTWNDRGLHHSIARDPSASVLTLNSGCGQVAVVHGDVAVCPFRTLSLRGLGSLATLPVEASRKVDRRALLQLEGEPRFLLTDGTDAGSKFVPAEVPSWPTDSSNPRLVESDGVHALFDTTLGVWMTDGTPKGTLRVGDTAQFFGHSVLATDGRFVAFDQNRQSWMPPDGVIGVAHGLLVGRIGCEAFSVDEARVRKAVTALGCVEQVEPGKDGALLRNAEGLTWLLRAGHDPFALVGDVHLPSGVHCGRSTCWYMSRAQTTFRANQLALNTGRVTQVAAVLLTEGVPPLGGSDFVLVTQQLDSGAVRFVATRPSGAQTPITRPFVFANDGALVSFAGGLSIIGPGGDSHSSLPCGDTLELGVTGNRINAICESNPVGSVTLWSGTLDAGLKAITVGNTFAESDFPSMPSGGDVAGFTVSSYGKPSRFVVFDGTDRIEFPGMFGGDFVQLRSGLVFAGGIESGKDRELWVLRDPRSGCGCGVGAESMFALAVVLLALRRRRLSVSAGAV